MSERANIDNLGVGTLDDFPRPVAAQPKSWPDHAGAGITRTVFVGGATGRFGGVCLLLLQRGHAVRAMTRTLGSPAGQRLGAAGVEMIAGDFDDLAGLTEAMRDVDAVIASGTLHKAGPEGELRHGRNIADAVAAAGVAHLVYVSGADAGAGTGVSIFGVKAAVERHIRSVDVQATIVAPVYLMENLFNPWNLDALRAGRVRSFVAPDRPVQQAAVADVIAFAALAIECPGRLAGERIEIASEEITAEQTVEVLARVTGRPFAVERSSRMPLGPNLAALFAWLDEHGHQVDIAALHQRYPDLAWHTFERWVREQTLHGAFSGETAGTTPASAYGTVSGPARRRL
jgi:uncharacterized protein YbjT (DUF2867 family)